jgi:hypothetical protein
MFEILGNVFTVFEIVKEFIEELGIDEELISKTLDILTKWKK